MSAQDFNGKDLPSVSISRVVVLGVFVLSVLTLIAAIGFENFSPTGRKISWQLTAILASISLVSLVVIWIDAAKLSVVTNSFNRTLDQFGIGLQRIKTIHRAAIFSFVVGGMTALIITLFIALRSFLGTGWGTEVITLAAIQFALKFTAVAAIIALITLRKQGQDSDQPAEDEEQAQQEKGEFQFGGAVFAFAFLVIAALIIPSDDLMRFADFFWGGEKHIEDYLPQQTTVNAYNSSQTERIVSGVMRNINETEHFEALQLFDLRKSISQHVSDVLLGDMIQKLTSRDALYLLESICQGNQGVVLMTNTDNRLVGEHLGYLRSENLIAMPYASTTNITVTAYGRQVIAAAENEDTYRDWRCIRENASQLRIADAITISDRTLTGQDSTTFAGSVSAWNFYDRNFVISEQTLLLAIELRHEFVYSFGLHAEDNNADPVLIIYEADRRGNLQVVRREDDTRNLYDSSSNARDAVIEFSLSGKRRADGGESTASGGPEQIIYLGLQSAGGATGLATLSISTQPRSNLASDTLSPSGDLPLTLPEQYEIANVVDIHEQSPTGSFQVPTTGLRFNFGVDERGSYKIQSRTSSTRTDNADRPDLIAFLWEIPQAGDEQYSNWRIIAQNDDSGASAEDDWGYDPVIVANLEAGKNYVYFLRPYYRGDNGGAVNLTMELQSDDQEIAPAATESSTPAQTNETGEQDSGEQPVIQNSN